MENQKLLDINNSLTMLPILQERLSKLERSIIEAEKDMQEILEQYNSEVLDVEQMKKDSLTNTVLKLFKKYDGKFDRETQEMIEAKREYDKASGRVLDLYNERDELQARISKLLENKQAFEAELKQREETIKSSITSKSYLIYRKLQEEREELSQQLIEISEAQRVAQGVQGTAESALEHLDSAEGWATYDIWARGGIISHMMKYDHIDNAQEAFNRLSYQIKDLKKELADINIFQTINNVGIDSTTRMFDFWFDNIFTDLNVRDKIREDQDEVYRLKRGISDIMTKLEAARKEVMKKLETIENKKKELLIQTEQ